MYIMLAARNGKSVYENQVNMIKNAKAHRNEITIRKKRTVSCSLILSLDIVQ